MTVFNTPRRCVWFIGVFGLVRLGEHPYAEKDHYQSKKRDDADVDGDRERVVVDVDVKSPCNNYIW